MTTITIPRNLIKEKDLVLLSRLQYENLLKHSKINNEEYEHLWKSAAKVHLFKSYSATDEVYDQV